MRISDWSSDVCSSDLGDTQALWHGDTKPLALEKSAEGDIIVVAEHGVDVGPPRDDLAQQLTADLDRGRCLGLHHQALVGQPGLGHDRAVASHATVAARVEPRRKESDAAIAGDRKSTRLNSSH